MEAGMNVKLNRLLDEIQRTEEKIAAWQERLNVLNERRKQMENDEIVKSIRSMRLGSREMLALLEGIQDGTVSFKNGGLSIPCGTQADITGGPGMEMDGEKYNVPKPARESGDLDHEKEV